MSAPADSRAFEQLGATIAGLTDREAAQSLSAIQLDLMFKGTAFEADVRRCLAIGDRSLLAHFIGQWRTALPRIVACARARAALLASPAASYLLDRIAELMLHPAATPDELQEAAARIEEIFARLR